MITIAGTRGLAAAQCISTGKGIGSEEGAAGMMPAAPLRVLSAGQWWLPLTAATSSGTNCAASMVPTPLARS